MLSSCCLSKALPGFAIMFYFHYIGADLAEGIIKGQLKLRHISC